MKEYNILFAFEYNVVGVALLITIKLCVTGCS
jgi:hypothetical protein